jgi:hypothetical protein
MERGEELPGMKFAGGFAFKLPGYGVSQSGNITPDMATGIGAWSKEMFVNTFRKHLDDPRIGMLTEPGGTLSMMPWAEYAGMTESDLGAIYAYLRTVEPVDHLVTKWANEEGLEAKDLPDAPALPAGIFSKLSVGSLCDTMTFGTEGLDAVAPEQIHGEIAKRAGNRAQLRGAPDWDGLWSKLTAPDAGTDWLDNTIKHHKMGARCEALISSMAALHADAAEPAAGKKNGKKRKKGRKK